MKTRIKKAQDVKLVTVLFDGKIVFLILPHIPMSRASVNTLKKSLGPILVKKWRGLQEQIPGVQRAELEKIVESQMGRNDPRFSLIFPDTLSMLEINKKTT